MSPPSRLPGAQAAREDRWGGGDWRRCPWTSLPSAAKPSGGGAGARLGEGPTLFSQPPRPLESAERGEAATAGLLWGGGSLAP